MKLPLEVYEYLVKHKGVWEIAHPGCMEDTKADIEASDDGLRLCWLTRECALICFSGEEDWLARLPE